MNTPESKAVDAARQTVASHFHSGDLLGATWAELAAIHDFEVAVRGAALADADEHRMRVAGNEMVTRLMGEREEQRARAEAAEAKVAALGPLLEELDSLPMVSTNISIPALTRLKEIIAALRAAVAEVEDGLDGTREVE